MEAGADMEAEVTPAASAAGMQDSAVRTAAATLGLAGLVLGLAVVMRALLAVMRRFPAGIPVLPADTQAALEAPG